MRIGTLLLACLLAGPVHARSLYWRSMDVVANLDSGGVLHVSETLAYVFDGDWNGGERSFNIRAGQQLELRGVSRLDNGLEVPLVNGDLSQVDHYELMQGNVLRWRSRLPSDPPFEGRTITYRITYDLQGILRREGTEYVLDHDFCFPSRSGRIEEYSLQLTTSPEWSGINRLTTMHRKNVVPGESVVVSARMTYSGANTPAAVEGLPPALPRAAVLAILLGLAAILFFFRQREQALGRFAPLPDLSLIDENWLRENVFSMPPEEVGAAWDGSVGSAEVAAVLARMAQEKKIESRVEKGGMFSGPVLHLKLLVDRNSLHGYERQLIDKLFFDSRSETDTKAIREQYSSTGLDLAGVVRSPLEQRLARLAMWSSKTRRAQWGRDVLSILGAAAVLIASGVVYKGNDTRYTVALIVAGFVTLLAAGIGAAANSNAVHSLSARFFLVALLFSPLLLTALALAWRATLALVHLTTLVGLVWWTLAIANLIAHALRTDHTAEKIAFRKKLAAARLYFVEQLRAREPRLRDEWLPYLLAFGLGNNVDRWFRASGGGTAGSAFATSGSSSSSSTGSSSGWTGGGGAFGGAGATGSWALAAGALASGVAAPSSSGGGGGGGGGGGSSGGGGGGGW